MHKKYSVSYYRSNLIPSMLFDSEKDADDFDTTLEEFVKNPQGRKEWEDSCSEYASIYAIAYHIDINDFELNGELSDKLICCCENMAAGCDGLEDDDCYRPVFRYIWSQFVPTGMHTDAYSQHHKLYLTK